jgi:hypothetical protein
MRNSEIGMRNEDKNNRTSEQQKAGEGPNIRGFEVPMLLTLNGDP